MTRKPEIGCKQPEENLASACPLEVLAKEGRRVIWFSDKENNAQIGTRMTYRQAEVSLRSSVLDIIFYAIKEARRKCTTEVTR